MDTPALPPLEISALPPQVVIAECTAPVNIAIVKYWGKHNEELILPINDSLSGTIHQDTMCAHTRIIASRKFTEDMMILNGKEEKIKDKGRLRTVMNECLARAQPLENHITSVEDWRQYKLKIESVNNFPTAAGLASSAAGLACLTATLAALYQLKESYPGELSAIARQGSGSACRSLYGGWVKWNKGFKEDGSDSIAECVADEHHWPEMRVLILVANQAQKETSSTSGMSNSVATSELLAYRAEKIVPRRMTEMETAILQKDFAQFCKLTTADSNQFHATCLDTSPPIFYLNETSKFIIHLCETLNTWAKHPIAAYTFDAGPNAVIYCLEKDMSLLLSLFSFYFLPTGTPFSQFVHDPMHLNNGTISSTEFVENNADLLLALGPQRSSTKVHQIIVSKVGPGPIVKQSRHTFS